MTDIRWKQRFNNYVSALRHLSNAIKFAEQRELSELEQQGMIQNFEVCNELAWKVMRDYLKEQGGYDGNSPKDAIKTAFNRELINDGQIWIDMLIARDKTSHTYDKKILDDLTKKIQFTFYPAFEDMQEQFNKRFQQQD